MYIKMHGMFTLRAVSCMQMTKHALKPLLYLSSIFINLFFSAYSSLFVLTAISSCIPCHAQPTHTNALIYES